MLLNSCKSIQLVLVPINMVVLLISLTRLIAKTEIARCIQLVLVPIDMVILLISLTRLNMQENVASTTTQIIFSRGQNGCIQAVDD